MFIVHGIGGRVGGGAQAALALVRAPGAVARAQRIAAATTDPDRPNPHAGAVADEGAVGGGGAAAPSALPALAAYAATEQATTARTRARVGDVMSHPALCLPLGASLLQAWQLLAQAGIAQAPVLDEQGALVGLLLRADLMHPARLAVAGANPAAWQALLAQPVSALMWTPVPAATPETDLRELARILLDTGLPGLAVADDQAQVTGFVSRSDILRAVLTEPPLDLWT